MYATCEIYIAILGTVVILRTVRIVESFLHILSLQEQNSPLPSSRGTCGRRILRGFSYLPPSVSSRFIWVGLAPRVSMSLLAAYFRDEVRPVGEWQADLWRSAPERGLYIHLGLCVFAQYKVSAMHVPSFGAPVVDRWKILRRTGGFPTQTLFSSVSCETVPRRQCKIRFSPQFSI